MEALPRMPMLKFELKTCVEATSFANLKKYIAESYHEDPASYSTEVSQFESLRSGAVRPTVDVQGCQLLKRYYCQLSSLSTRFPHLSERQVLTFSWRDTYSNAVAQTTDISFEMAHVLFNIAALHSQLGAADARTTPDGMKLACTHFQCAAWSYGHLRDQYPSATVSAVDMSVELLIFMQQVSFAQAQECILEKSLVDIRKSAIVAKVTAQIVTYYNAALAALLTGGDDSCIAETVGNKVMKEWKRYVKFKIAYANAILFLYQSQQAEEARKMGERVTLTQAAFDKLEEARKEAKGMPKADMDKINEALTFAMDVIETKRRAAQKENEFIYHEDVPELKTLTAVKGANLVNGIAFSVTDPEIAGNDIFARLIPMEAHEASSLYSEQKAQLLREIGQKINDRDTELESFRSSLNLETLNVEQETTVRFPQGLVDRCALLNANPDAISNLVASMSHLAETCVNVEATLHEVKELLDEEAKREKTYQQTMGTRPSVHFAELNREFVKYQEAHIKASDSNEMLRKAMELHVTNLKVLAQPLSQIQAVTPTAKDLTALQSDGGIAQLRMLVSKVDEMRAQRIKLFDELREATIGDDITFQLLAIGDKPPNELFTKELAKHDKQVAVIEQNLTAQTNILKALTESYAKFAPTLKMQAEIKHKREQFFTGLMSSYDVYEDLIAKSSKGLEFYKKLQGNLVKLLARVKGARDVHDEERQQRLVSSKPEARVDASSRPKLKDYFKSGSGGGGGGSSGYVSLVRPNPLGSEQTTTPACATMPADTTPPMYYAPPDIDPPPPYTPYTAKTCAPHTASYYDHNQTAAYATAGYTNPMYAHHTATAYGAPSQPIDYSQAGQPPVYTQQAQPQETITHLPYQQYAAAQQQSQYMASPMASNEPVPLSSITGPMSNLNLDVYRPPSQPAPAYDNQNYYTTSMPQYSYGAATAQSFGYVNATPVYNPGDYYAQVSVESYEPQPQSQQQQHQQPQYAVQQHQQYYEQPSSQMATHITDPQSSSSSTMLSHMHGQQMQPQPITDQPYPEQYRHNQNIPQYNNATALNYNGAYSQANHHSEQFNVVPAIAQLQPQQQQQQQHPHPSAQSMSQPAPVHGVTPPNTQSIPVAVTANAQQQQQPVKVVGSKNLDLLSGIDIVADNSMPPLVPLLQPKLAEQPPPKLLIAEKVVDKPAAASPAPLMPLFEATQPNELSNTITSSSSTTTGTYSSALNDLSFFESTLLATVAGAVLSPPSIGIESIVKSKVNTPLDDPKVLNWFKKEVERLEKLNESLKTKMLNGCTPLDSKWNELQDLLVKDEAKRTITVGKLFPEKNRSADSIPYDHARVLLPTNTDDYINASHLRDLGPLCPWLILTQTPMQNTIKDFWLMIWSQKSKLIVCLHSTTEILDTFWPDTFGKETMYGDFSVTLESQFELSHCHERTLKLKLTGADEVQTVSLLQIKGWSKSNPDCVLRIAHNILTAADRSGGGSCSGWPLVLSCCTAAERSGIVALGLAAISATQANNVPVLLNMVDVWYRICSQRKGALRDSSRLHFSLKIILANAHELLNKHGIMTSYQMNKAQATQSLEMDVQNDPLNNLDPLWKLK